MFRLTSTDAHYWDDIAEPSPVTPVVLIDSTTSQRRSIINIAAGKIIISVVSVSSRRDELYCATVRRSVHPYRFLLCCTCPSLRSSCLCHLLSIILNIVSNNTELRWAEPYYVCVSQVLRWLAYYFVISNTFVQLPLTLIAQAASSLLLLLLLLLLWMWSSHNSTSLSYTCRRSL